MIQQKSKFSQKVVADRNFRKQNHFSIFCSSTSLHGWKYLDLESHPRKRLVWLVVLLGACGLATNFAWMNIKVRKQFTIKSEEILLPSEID